MEMNTNPSPKQIISHLPQPFSIKGEIIWFPFMELRLFFFPNFIDL